MTATRFNRTRLRAGGFIREPDQAVIEASLNLRQAGLGDAARYGGPIMREALDALTLHGDRRYVVVDTKVNFLMPGFVPAIPGWHTDGVPRGEDLDPSGRGEPNLGAQEAGLITAPRYHLLVTGDHSPTQFIGEEIVLDLPHSGSRDLYALMTEAVDQRLADSRTRTRDVESCQWTEFDWWDIHRAVPATDTGWRYLIRVAETDHIAPRTSPSEFIRSQSQVYVNPTFGW